MSTTTDEKFGNKPQIAKSTWGQKPDAPTVRTVENIDEYKIISKAFDRENIDLIMPVKDGFTTLEEIKKNDDLKSIPVLIATNLGQKEDIEKGMKMGAVDYLVKTDTSIDDFVNKIQGVLKA